MLKKILNTKTIIFTILTIFLILCIPKILDLLMLLFASYIIAAALNPIVNKIQKKVKNRAIATSIAITLTIGILLCLLLPVISMCYNEIELVINIIPNKLSNLYNFMSITKIHGHTLYEMFPISSISQMTSSPDIAQNVVNQSLNITKIIGGTIFVLLATMMFVFYTLVDKQYLMDKYIEFFPPNLKEKAGTILRSITTKVGSYVRAQICVMLLVGILITIMVSLLGIEYPVLLGIISGICELIPILGPTIAISIILVIAFPLGIGKMILTLILFLVIQQIIAYIIKPLLFGKFMKLHPITILVAVIVAEQFLGIAGAILSPAIAATICVLVDELYLTPMNSTEKGQILIEQQ